MFLARSLDRGGAERQLVRLAIGLHERGHQIAVVQLLPGNALHPDLRTAGIPCHSLASSRWSIPILPVRVIQALRRHRPAVVHAYLPVANIAACLARPFVGRPAVVLGVRATTSERPPSLAVRSLYRLEQWASKFAAATIANSQSARRWLTQRGFESARIHVIPNGIDTEEFRPNSAARASIRRELGIDDAALVVGRVAGLRPNKDFPTLLRAMAEVCEQRRGARLVCVGGGDPRYAAELAELAESLGLRGTVWTGERSDVADVIASFDVAASSSTTESFPNVVAEAMASGVPCVVTDVGDSADIVGEYGKVVPPSSPHELADALIELLDRLGRDGEGLKAQARATIEARYSVSRMLDATEAILDSVAAAGSHGG